MVASHNIYPAPNYIMETLDLGIQTQTHSLSSRFILNLGKKESGVPGLFTELIIKTSLLQRV